MTLRSLLLSLFLGLACASAGADDLAVQTGVGRPSSLSDATWVARGALARGDLQQARTALEEVLRSHTQGEPYASAVSARTLALGAGAMAGRDTEFSDRLAREAAQRLRLFESWLDDYGQMVDAHGFEEPAWVRGDPGAVAEAVLAWVELQKHDLQPDRRQLIARFSEGLGKLGRPSPAQYPFRAHASLMGVNGPEYVPNPRGGVSPGSLWVAQRARQVEALVAASEVLDDPQRLVWAEREGMGMLAHMVVSGKLIKGFAPRPEPDGTLREASVLVDGLMALHQATARPVYAVLAGVGAGWLNQRAPADPAEEGAASLIRAAVANTPAQSFSQARDLLPPSTYQVMDAENGRAVQKAFEVTEVTYPLGTAGQTVTVGRENMFWMRFDVPREDDYYFYLIFLKNEVAAGLTSVMMRIDGDKIFEVPLGGASGTPIVDMDLVEGPRLLRQGPHSFGIRFSGLLMTRPAVLDAVVVQPVVERRVMQLADGSNLMLLKNLSPEPAPVEYSEVSPWPPASLAAYDGSGAEAEVGYETDRRRRKNYLVVPPAGVTVIQWRPDKPVVE